MKEKVIQTRTADGDQLEIKIKISDYFSITGAIWEKGKRKTDNAMISCGCIHDDILRARPDLKIFVRLHLADLEGVPMHAIANGFYYLKNGFSDTLPTDDNFPDEFSSYYRMTLPQFKEIAKCKTKLAYAGKLHSLGIVSAWAKESEEAMRIFKELTK